MSLSNKLSISDCDLKDKRVLIRVCAIDIRKHHGEVLLSM